MSTPKKKVKKKPARARKIPTSPRKKTGGSKKNSKGTTVKTKATQPLFNFKQGIKVLALGAHADDIELGCGATLFFLKERMRAEVHYRVFSDHYEQPQELNRREDIERAVEMLGVDSYWIYTFTDTQFPVRWRDIQYRVSQLRNEINPDLIFAPRLNDNHQDHVVVAEAAAREFRQGQALWHYEIKQYGQDEFPANIFVDVSGRTERHKTDENYQNFLERLGSPDPDLEPKPAEDTYAHLKLYLLHETMLVEKEKPFMHSELVLGAMRHRGLQTSPNTPYAEAFSGKVLVG